LASGTWTVWTTPASKAVSVNAGSGSKTGIAVAFCVVDQADLAVEAFECAVRQADSTSARISSHGGW
jgi:hypothetical protein